MITLEIDPSTFDGDNNPPEVKVDDICIVNPEGNWHLYNHGHLELTKNCDEQYLSFWESPTYTIKDLLVVGGGDLQVASKFIEEYDCSVDVVDPYVFMYKDFHEFYLNKKFSYSFYRNHINFIEQTFFNFLGKEYNKKFYDLVCIDCSEPVMGLTDEIYSEQFFSLLNLINTNYYVMYMPPTVYDKLVPILRQNFTMISSKGDFVNDWNEQCDIITFIK